MDDTLNTQQIAAKLLPELQAGKNYIEDAQKIGDELISVCELLIPTVRKKSVGSNYTALTNSKLQDALNDRDTMLYEVANVFELFLDKSMDLDSLMGHSLATVAKSIDILTTDREVNHE